MGIPPFELDGLRRLAQQLREHPAARALGRALLETSAQHFQQVDKILVEGIPLRVVVEMRAWNTELAQWLRNSAESASDRLQGLGVEVTPDEAFLKKAADELLPALNSPRWSFHRKGARAAVHPGSLGYLVIKINALDTGEMLERSRIPGEKDFYEKLTAHPHVRAGLNLKVEGPAMIALALEHCPLANVRVTNSSGETQAEHLQPLFRPPDSAP